MNYKLILNLIVLLRTKGSFIRKPTEISSSQTVSLQQTSSQLGKNNFSYNIITPLIPAIVEGEASQEVENLSLIDTYNESEIIGKIIFLSFLFIQSSYDIV